VAIIDMASRLNEACARGVDRVRLMILHATEDVDEVVERIDPAGLAGGDE